jgi:hypothetical protein
MPKPAKSPNLFSPETHFSRVRKYTVPIHPNSLPHVSAAIDLFSSSLHSIIHSPDHAIAFYATPDAAKSIKDILSYHSPPNPFTAAPPPPYDKSHGF